MMAPVFSLSDTVWYIAAIYILNMLFILAVIFAERKSPSATLAWILVLAFIPIVGFIFYVVFNQNFSRSKINKLTDKEEYVASNALKQQIEDLDDDKIELNFRETKNWKHLIKLNQVYGHSYYTQNNNVELITDGNDLTARMIEDIRRAKNFVHVEYFIVKNDAIGIALIDLLTQKAREGLEVRLLLDALGSRKISRFVLSDYLKAGGKVGYFFKPKLAFIAPKLNYRNHRKIVVIDGEIGYTGGYNVAREYVGRKKRFGYWRDTHVRITGGAVADLNTRFVLDWRFTTHEEIGFFQPYFMGWGSGEAGQSGVQIVSCGPESPSEEVKRAMMRMITYAEKRVWLQTPYFVPDAAIFESLKMAAQSGVDVRVMIPCKPDHIFVYWATYSYVGELLRSGGRAFIYDNGFLHAKTLVVDGEVGTVGSTNFDNRSFRLNFETNAFVFDPKFAKEMESAFEFDLEQNGHELTYEDYLKRGPIIKFKEAISRLLSDIL